MTRPVRHSRPAPTRAGAPAAQPAADPARALTLRWEGAFFSWHSLAHVNREVCLGLVRAGAEVSVVPTEPRHFGPEQAPRFQPLAERCFAPLSRDADVHVRHFFPPRLNRSSEGRLVLMQPWEYGFLPQDWVGPIRQNVDEVWCYSAYVRDVYRDSGIDEGKLRIVPLGIDPAVFRPNAPPYVFTDEPGAERLRTRAGSSAPRPFTFLFVGGTLHRKGIDILLDAYLGAFSAYDDVCLVVKDTGVETVYRGQNERDRIIALAGDRLRAPIVYIDADLSPHRLSGLYTACDCVVLPYRGEGFCLPALEAMACGAPVIVPEGGPTDDFVDETVGARVPAERRPYGDGTIGEWDCVGPTWMLEVSPLDLGRAMRAVRADPENARERGRRGAERARAGWTWAHTAAVALERLTAVGAATAVPARVVVDPPRPGPAASRRGAAPRRAGSGPKSHRGRPMPTVALCMIVKDEERVLADCLSSVKEHVDDMIVVDTGSTDRTVEIASGFGARVFHFAWCDSFAAARNYSLEQSHCDWNFWMDADDTLPAECGPGLREQAFLAESRTQGVMMQVHIPPGPGEYGFTIVDHVKLFRNKPAHRFEGRIHEQIMEAIYAAGGVIARSLLYVIHSGYDRSPEGQRKKRRRDLKLLEMDLADNPNHPFKLFNMGMTLFHFKEIDAARGWLLKALAAGKRRESTARKVYAMLAGCDMEQRDLAGARGHIETGLRLFPRDPELLFRGANLFHQLGDLPAAERMYRTLLTDPARGHIDSLDASMGGYKARHNLAMVYRDMGRLQDSEAEWRAAVEESPGFVPSWVGLAELYAQTRRFDDAAAIVVRIEQIDPAQAAQMRRRVAEAR